MKGLVEGRMPQTQQLMALRGERARGAVVVVDGPDPFGPDQLRTTAEVVLQHRLFGEEDVKPAGIDREEQPDTVVRGESTVQTQEGIQDVVDVDVLTVADNSDPMLLVVPTGLELLGPREDGHKETDQGESLDAPIREETCVVDVSLLPLSMLVPFPLSRDVRQPAVGLYQIEIVRRMGMVLVAAQDYIPLEQVVVHRLGVRRGLPVDQPPSVALACRHMVAV